MQPSNKIIQQLIQETHPEWHAILEKALKVMDAFYLERIMRDPNWFPGTDKLLAAFNIPRTQLRYILLGESPYPRSDSANGYAFWDGAVGSLWSETGLSKAVNRATSLRNMIKMFLYARGDLQHDYSQNAIALLDKTPYAQTAHELFNNFIDKGFLLLNATLVYEEDCVLSHAKHWRPFISSLLTQLAKTTLMPQLILLGRIASQVPESKYFDCVIAEHPYNLSFITNPSVLNFFQPLDLLGGLKRNV